MTANGGEDARTFGALRGGGRGRVLLVVALGWFLTLGMRYVVPTLLPQIRAEYGINNATAGLAVTAVWAGYALMQFPAGALADRLGERKLLVGSLFAAAGSLVVLAASSTLVAFMLGCGLFGLATGLFGPARGMTLSRTFPDSEGSAFGLTLAIGSVGSALLPFLAGLLVGPLGWQTTIVLAVPGFVVVGGATWLIVSNGANGSETDAQAVEETDEDEEASEERDVPLTRALWTAINRRRVVVPVAAITLVMFGLEGVTAFLPTYLHDVGGLRSEVAAAVYALFFVGGALGQVVAGNLSDRFGDRVVLVAVATVNVVALIAVPFVSGLVPLAVVVFALGTRNGIAPISNAYIIAVLPDEIQGTAWGMLRTGFFLLGSTGSIVVGWLADRGQFAGAFYLIAATTAVAALLYLVLPNRRLA